MSPPASIFPEPGDDDAAPSLFGWAADRADEAGEQHHLDPADTLPTREDRARAFEQWQRDGRPFPPPAGLVSSCLRAVIHGRAEDRDA